MISIYLLYNIFLVLLIKYIQYVRIEIFLKHLLYYAIYILNKINIKIHAQA